MRFVVALVLCLAVGCSDPDNDSGNVEVDAGSDDVSADARPDADTGGAPDSGDGEDAEDDTGVDLEDAGEDVAEDAGEDLGEDADDAGDDADAADDAGDDADMPDVPDLPPCLDEQVEAEAWPEGEVRAWEGSIELGQTHVVRPDDDRLAPRTSPQRSTLLLFTPDTPVADDTVVRVGAWQGELLLGVLRMRAPSALPAALESALTDVPLAPYSTDAWSAVLPWSWVEEGVELRVGRAADDGVEVFEHTLTGLAAPHVFTITRAKIVLFGEPDFPTATEPTPRIAQDYFAALPATELRWVDGQPWRLDEMVIRTPDGPALVGSEIERQVLVDEDHWSILKHQFALRMSLANTGRGLALTGESQGDNSPYSFGTSLGQGWFRTPEGNYRDIDDAPWAAGWTGWTAMWLGECGNGFIHEVGHSLTMAHFTEGTASNWGIADEYPRDGANLESHPWGWDTTRNRFRTWYRVDGGGPVMAEDEVVGKRDPMNGGESPNAVTCFPQYTGYHGQKAQRWMNDTPTIMEVDGVAGVYRWDSGSRGYVREAADGAHQEPTGVRVPVATLVGTLGRTPDASQVYPPIYFPSGNTFALPDPFGDGLDAVFDGARWYVEVVYADDASDFALIARGAIEDPNLYLFSLNVGLERQPVAVRLFESAVGYPNIDPDDAELVFERALEPPGPWAPVVTVGRGKVANAGLTLTTACEAGLNCETRAVESTWRTGAAPLHFGVGAEPDPAECLEPGDYTEFEVDVQNGDQNLVMTLRAQRVVRAGELEVRVPLHDATPWLQSPDANQSLRVWVPWGPNSELPEGRYTLSDPVVITAYAGQERFAETTLTLDLEVLAAEAVDLGEEFVSDGLTSADSSMYFVARDGSVGPTSRVWWGDNGATSLRVPVVDSETQELAILAVDAQQEACGQRWQMHAGRGAGDCEHALVLRIAAEGNDGLTPGRTYRTLASAPLVIEGRRWHDPDARRLEGVFALDITYTP